LYFAPSYATEYPLPLTGHWEEIVKPQQGDDELWNAQKEEWNELLTAGDAEAIADKLSENSVEFSTWCAFENYSEGFEHTTGLSVRQHLHLTNRALNLLHKRRPDLILHILNRLLFMSVSERGQITDDILIKTLNHQEVQIHLGASHLETLLKLHESLRGKIHANNHSKATSETEAITAVINACSQK
jgi:hypothetical protein